MAPSRTKVHNPLTNIESPGTKRKERGKRKKQLTAVEMADPVKALEDFNPPLARVWEAAKHKAVNSPSSSGYMYFPVFSDHLPHAVVQIYFESGTALASATSDEKTGKCDLIVLFFSQD